MTAYWKFVREMLKNRTTVTWAAIFALISATGLGIGLLSIFPMLSAILNGTSLPELAREFNQADHALTIPAGVIDRLPIDSFEGVVVMVVIVMILTVVGGFANFMHQYLSQTLATRTVARIRQQAFQHVIHLPLGTVIKRGPTDYVARIIRDAAELQRGFIALTSKAITQILKGLAAFIVAVVVNWPLTLTAIVTAPLLVIVLRKLGKRIRRGTRGSLAAQESMLRIATESMHGLRAVKANTGEREAGRWFHRINKIVVQQELKIRTARALTSPIVEVIATLVVILLAIVAAKLIIVGSIPPAGFMLALGALAIAGASFRPLAGLINEVQAATAPAGRLAEILAEPREVTTAVRRRLPRHQVSIEFEDVSFAYPGTETPALDHISLTIAHGERLAIVGPNGCGKTTMVSLLPRLLEPGFGRVLIDGHDIATVNLQGLRRQIGVVTQETVIFRGTVAQNIAFGAKQHTTEAIEEAARRARADSFIRELSHGYQTDIAEQGATLSGGQRQRLAIARAILRDPAILILDEATSQIDSESESQINAALDEFCNDRTAIVIAHRISSMQNADRIVVMDKGRIEAVGTHHDLLASCELYNRLVQTQRIST